MSASPWGSNDWGEQAWGDNGIDVSVSNAWGEQAWGEFAWGEGNNLNTLTTQTNPVTVDISVNVTLTGISLTSVTGEVVLMQMDLL